MSETEKIFRNQTQSTLLLDWQKKTLVIRKSQKTFSWIQPLNKKSEASGFLSCSVIKSGLFVRLALLLDCAMIYVMNCDSTKYIYGKLYIWLKWLAASWQRAFHQAIIPHRQVWCRAVSFVWDCPRFFAYCFNFRMLCLKTAVQSAGWPASSNKW